MSINYIIAKAIKKADKSYFFENYTKQAKSVLRALKKEGYAIVPLSPTEEMEEAGIDAIMSGKIKPKMHVRQIYEAMAEHAHKGGK